MVAPSEMPIGAKFKQNCYSSRKISMSYNDTLRGYHVFYVTAPFL